MYSRQRTFKKKDVPSPGVSGKEKKEKDSVGPSRSPTISERIGRGDGHRGWNRPGKTTVPVFKEGGPKTGTEPNSWGSTDL